MNLRTRLGQLGSAVVCRGHVAHAAEGRFLPLRTVADVLDLLEDAAASVRADPLTRPAEKARSVARLAAVALKAIEAGNLAARVEMLEAVLKQRHGGGAP